MNISVFASNVLSDVFIDNGSGQDDVLLML